MVKLGQLGQAGAEKQRFHAIDGHILEAMVLRGIGHQEQVLDRVSSNWAIIAFVSSVSFILTFE